MMAPSSRSALHWVFTLATLAPIGCGGAARSGAPDAPAPEEETPSLFEPSPVLPSEAVSHGTEPLPTAPAPPLSPPVVPSECRGVVGSSGTPTVEVRNQHELDALAECATIVGDLAIQAFDGVDLRPLASLRTVQGTFTLGSLYDDPPPSGFSSLEGLENLEGVAGLSLRGVQAPSLRALGSLSHFVPFADDTHLTNEGFLFIDHCSELTDLGGLERLEGLRGIVLKSDGKLTSLRGIQIPELLDMLEVWDSPVEDLGDPSRLTEVRNTLWFNHTALQSAAGLERVTRVDQLQFWGNSALRDLSALSALTEVRYLNLIENPQLEVLPRLDGLRTLTGLGVSDNAALRELPSIPATNVQEAWIERNASLERSLAGAKLRRAGQLRVADNPQLSSLDLSQLRQVGDLWVTNNPALDDTALRGLEFMGAGTVRIAGNLGQALPLAECPWAGDGICDGPQHPYGVCADGTDPDCIPWE